MTFHVADSMFLDIRLEEGDTLSIILWQSMLLGVRLPCSPLFRLDVAMNNDVRCEEVERSMHIYEDQATRRG